LLGVHLSLFFNLVALVRHAMRSRRYLAPFKFCLPRFTHPRAP
jgi:hypothetical protein